MKVIHLKSNNDHNNINMIKKHMKTKPSLVFMVAPWCGFCQRLQPTIDTLENELVDEPEFKRVSLITVSYDQLKHIGQKVKSYPTIRMFKNGRQCPIIQTNLNEKQMIFVTICANIWVIDNNSKKSKKSKKNSRMKNVKTFKMKKNINLDNYKGW